MHIGCALIIEMWGREGMGSGIGAGLGSGMGSGSEGEFTREGFCGRNSATMGDIGGA